VRQPPINYVVSLAAIAVLWIAGAVFAGNFLSDNAALTNATPEDFTRVYRIVMSIAAASVILGLVHWYLHGSKDATAANPDGARRFWTTWLFALVIASVVCVAGLVLAFLGEHFTATEYLIMFGSSSLLTWIPFWLCSLPMSPRGVKNAPLGMR
jgi:F0F1-type ATP synthase membrane subunit c/vacuolar-type H+-ATPase subunit K